MSDENWWAETNDDTDSEEEAALSEDASGASGGAAQSLHPTSTEEEERQLRLAMQNSVEDNRRQEMSDIEFEQEMRQAIRASLQMQPQSVGGSDSLGVEGRDEAAAQNDQINEDDPVRGVEEAPAHNGVQDGQNHRGARPRDPNLLSNGGSNMGARPRDLNPPSNGGSNTADEDSWEEGENVTSSEETEGEGEDGALPLASTAGALPDHVKRRLERTFEKSLELRRSLLPMQACKAITTNLFPHQKLALMWMYRRENSKDMGVRGGILADEMGLGKTLVIISLVLTNFQDGQPLAKPVPGRVRCYTPGVLRYMPSAWINALQAQETNTAGMSGRDRMRLMWDAARRGAARAVRDARQSSSRSNSRSLRGIKRRRRHSSDDVVVIRNSDEEDETSGNNQTSNSDGVDEFDQFISLPSLRERVGVREEDLTFPGPSGGHNAISLNSNASNRENINDGNLHFGDGLSDDEEYMAMTEEERNRRYMPNSDSNVNLDGSSDLPVPLELSAEEVQNLIIPPDEPFTGTVKRRATLIVTPASLISQWVQQIEEHVDSRVELKIFVHHGTSKASDVRELADQDVVFTTYGTLGAEYNSSVISSPLLRVKWLRVVLDEGHFIKNHSTRTAKAAAALNTERKWIVSGTPVQNNLKEFWALLSWLKFQPYARNRPLFRDEIERLAARQDPRGLDRLKVLGEAIVMRRTKNEQVNGRPLVSLPQKCVVVKEVEFSREEEAIYRAFEENSRETIRRFMRRGALMSNYAHIFELMVRLRQLCCHRELIDGNWASLDVDQFLAEAERQLNEELQRENPQQYLATRLRDLLATGMTDDCAICMSDYVNPVITKCFHIFCRQCISHYIHTAHGQSVACPLCRSHVFEQELTEAAPPVVEEEEEESSNSGLDDPYEDIVVELSSSKINACLKEVLGALREEPDTRIVIVSQFTKLLSMLQPLLDEQGLTWTRLDGSMTARVRSTVVAQFQQNAQNSPKIMLLSMKAGGVGLNLTAASRLILLEPAWNPATEEQCFDRLHRVGQMRDVHITKLIMKNSIEQRILSIQQRKRGMIRGLYGDSGMETRGEQRMEEIRELFGLI